MAIFRDAGACNSRHLPVGEGGGALHEAHEEVALRALHRVSGLQRHHPRDIVEQVAHLPENYWATVVPYPYHGEKLE